MSFSILFKQTIPMKYFALIVFLFFLSCTAKKEVAQTKAKKEAKTKIELKKLKVWINTEYVECKGHERCLSIIEGDRMSEDLWKPFDGTIIGFEEFEPNTYYFMEIEELGKGDNGFMKYELINIISQKPMKEETPIKEEKQSVVGKWQVKSMAQNKEEIPANAHILLNTKFNSIAGNDGCNQLAGKIIKLNEKEISFSPLRTTKKMCRNTAKFSRTFITTLGQVTQFSIADNSMSLMNSSGETVLILDRK